jgi:Flp pilus assembly protein TadD
MKCTTLFHTKTSESVSCTRNELHSQEAARDCRAALAAAPTCSKAAVRLGLCLESLGELDDALAAFRNALSLELPASLSK